MAKVALTALLALSFLGSAAQAQLRPMAQSGWSSDPAYVAWRCSDFTLAIRSSALRQRAALSSARPEIWKDPYVWVHDKSLQKRIQQAIELHPTNENDFVVDYLEAFQAVELPTPFSELELYKSDKATCLSRFGNE